MIPTVAILLVMLPVLAFSCTFSPVLNSHGKAGTKGELNELSHGSFWFLGDRVACWTLAAPSTSVGVVLSTDVYGLCAS